MLLKGTLPEIKIFLTSVIIQQEFCKNGLNFIKGHRNGTSELFCYSPAG
jgi:hypothetical protein